MTKHKVADLVGALLDAAVAKAHGYDFRIDYWMTVVPRASTCWLVRDGKVDFEWAPSTSWADGGGQIIERERIALAFLGGQWFAWAAANGLSGSGWYDEHSLDVSGDDADGTGPAPLVAAMRAFVASKLGREVDL